jgi:N6-L-threonylcarbamoyladenine synthase
MTVLGVETSCDETSVAIVRDGLVLANVVASQIQLHSDYGGVVPELAARAHLKNLPPVARLALEKAGVRIEAIEGFAATRGPGLPMALLVGWRFAQATAFARNRPCVAVHHHEAHLFSPWIQGTPPHANFETFEPNISLVVSGGHTMLVDVPTEHSHRVLGGTIDDAAGECFDKTAKLIGLPYPGGPELDRLAEEGNPKAFEFPRPLLRDRGDDFSFSGLKTSVRYFLRDHPSILTDGPSLRDLCASVRSAIVDVLVTKTIRAAERLGRRCVTASGGVSCNRALRRQLAAECGCHGLTLRLVEPTFATDNAAMIAVVGERKLLRETAPTDFTLEADPSWRLEEIPQPPLQQS